MGQYKYTTKSHGVKWSAKFRYLNPETGEMDIEYRRGFDTKREAKQYEDDFLEELKGLEKASPSPAQTYILSGVSGVSCFTQTRRSQALHAGD